MPPTLRTHLFEFAELPGCPRVIRDGVTDYLQHVITKTRPYDGAVPVLRDLLARPSATADGKQCIVDMGSGGGGPWRTLASALGSDVHVTLTDAFPNVAAFEVLERESGGQIRGERTPMRAEAMPPHLTGLRTMFSAFHHLTPRDAVALLRATVRQGHPIAIFEATRRDGVAMQLTLITPLLVLLMTPAIRPFRWSRLLLTYLIPVIPLTVLFDGLVSCWRTYTPDELLQLAREAAPDGVMWQAGLIPGGPIPVTYLTGTPISG
jgi:hypothetical protein